MQQSCTLYVIPININAKCINAAVGPVNTKENMAPLAAVVQLITPQVLYSATPWSPECAPECIKVVKSEIWVNGLHVQSVVL